MSLYISLINNATTESKTMNPAKYIDKQEKIADLADKYLDEAIAKGESFSEGLCNWASHKAEQELGSLRD
jgi:hypothetical protein